VAQALSQRTDKGSCAYFIIARRRNAIERIRQKACDDVVEVFDHRAYPRHRRRGGWDVFSAVLDDTLVMLAFRRRNEMSHVAALLL
jgi:hypothetical protein